MLIYNHTQFQVYFGNESEGFPLTLQDAYSKKSAQEFAQTHPFSAIIKCLQAPLLVKTKQVHGTDGLIITSHAHASDLKPFTLQADYLITQIPQIALAVATADCLPLVFYDTRHHAIAIAHAGWRGTVDGIAQKTVKDMHVNFGTNPTDLIVLFGPAARTCCYEVGQDFKALVAKYQHNVFIERNGKFFFDVTRYNLLELISIGVIETAIDLTYNLCTICNKQFCSYRRQKERGLRQLTVIALKSRTKPTIKIA